MQHQNWAGNFRYSAARVHRPGTVDEVREIVRRAGKVKALGSRHSFNGIGDTEGDHISLERLNKVIELRRAERTVKVQGGIRYGDLCAYLHREGFALHNLASLPHISVAGACATATHGSGDRHGSLATAVSAVEIVAASGEVVSFSRAETPDVFHGAVVSLGALGVVVSLTLDLVPAFDVGQEVYEELPLDAAVERFDEIFGLGYSVSLFTTWRRSAFDQVWVKRLAGGEAGAEGRAVPGAKNAQANLHPIPGADPANCTEQLGVPGPWHERLPHFRMAFVPSAGDELQSEFFVARRHAPEALRALDRIKERLAPALHASEVRTIAADTQWLSPCYGRDSVGFHFTWKKDREKVRPAIAAVEEALSPFDPRPHWGKLFTMPPGRVQGLYEKLPDFRRLALELDPQGKFRNAFLDTYVFGS